MAWIIILLIIGVVLYFFFKDRNKALESQVDNQGGMRQKYSELISWLEINQKAKITKVARDYLEISCIMPTTSTCFSIMETFNGVEIEWNAKFGVLGNHNRKWNFSSATSQKEIIERIEMDLKELENSLF